MSFERLPQAVVDMARTGFIDSIGTMLAGSREPVVRILADTLGPAPGDAPVLLGHRTASGPDAAFINATATHALDFDDTSLSAHPSAALVPAILAEAAHVGADGRRMLLAYAAGYETWAELALRDRGPHQAKGWHPTGIFGPIAAAAACAVVRGLDASGIATAISLGASQSAGIVANFGSMAKPFHAGRAAHAGVLSARLAHAGMTASADALEHPHGFLMAVSPQGGVDRSVHVIGADEWRLASIGLNIKQFPTCYCTHRPIDAMLELRNAHASLPAQRIAGIEVSMSARNAAVLRNHAPRTGLEAKFSIEFAMACAWLAGEVKLAQLQDDFVLQDDVQQLMRRVHVVVDPREDAATGYAPFDQVTLVLDNGARHASADIHHARGAARLPLAMTELRAKFMDCACVVASTADATALFDQLARLEALADPRALLIARRH